jgi:membrane-associated phospholipid phosphatase
LKKIDSIIIVLVLVWSVLAGYFALNDLNISETIVDQQTGWAEFLEQYGELPGAVVIIFGIVIFSIQLKKSSVVIFTAIQSILVIALSAILLYVSYLLIFNITSSSNAFFDCSAFLSIAFFASSTAAIVTFRKANLNFSFKLITISKIILGMSLFGYLLSIQIIKFFWGRVRYRDLDFLHSNFTEWFIANGINGHQSFPSGHAAMGWMLLPIFLLVLDKSGFIKSFIMILIFIIAATIALSRVVIGAHYASDVLFGSLFMIISFLILYRRYYLRDDKVRKNLK